MLLSCAHYMQGMHRSVFQQYTHSLVILFLFSDRILFSNLSLLHFVFFALPTPCASGSWGGQIGTYTQYTGGMGMIRLGDRIDRHECNV